MMEQILYTAILALVPLAILGSALLSEGNEKCSDLVGTLLLVDIGFILTTLLTIIWIN